MRGSKIPKTAFRIWKTAFRIEKTAFRIGKGAIMVGKITFRTWTATSGNGRSERQARKKVCSGLSGPESSTDGQESLSEKVKNSDHFSDGRRCQESHLPRNKKRFVKSILLF